MGTAGKGMDEQTVTSDATCFRFAGYIPLCRLEKCAAGHSASCYILAPYSNWSNTTMSTGSIFVNNRTQAVRLPVESRFPDQVKRVVVRVVGQDRILSPVDHAWDSFFIGNELPSADFMVERASQEQAERESF
jgi:antitoxin VapB